MTEKTNRWTGKGHDHLWSNAANWSLGEPAPGQNLLFSGSASFTLDLTGVQPAIGKMTVNGDHLTLRNARLDLNAAPPKRGLTTDLLLQNGASLALVSDAILAATNFVQLGGVVKGALTPGTLTLSNHAGGWSAGFNIVEGSLTLTGEGTGWSPSGANNGGFDVFIGGGAGSGLTISAGASLSSQTSVGSEITVGNGIGAGLVSVTGAGSLLSIGHIYLGNGYSGVLTVANFATVQTGILNAGLSGDGTVLVTSHGILEAADGLVIGSTLVPVGSRLDITNHGSVYAGTSGLVLEEGTLTLDPTATLFGGIISLGGHIDAVANAHGAPGTVTLGQAVSLGDLYADGQFGNITTAGSSGGAMLDLAGPLTGLPGSVLAINGLVKLSSGHGSLSTVALGTGTLVVAANGALGGGTLSFANAYSHQADTAELVLLRGVQFGNAITDMGTGDTIDLRGFVFGNAFNASFADNTLTISDVFGTASLHVVGTFATSDFFFDADQAGGTLIHLR